MQPVATDVARFVVLVTPMNPAKTDEPIEMLFCRRTDLCGPNETAFTRQ